MAEAGTITVNGEERPLSGSMKVVTLLEEMGIQPNQQGVAVAVNGEVVARSEWSSVRLANGDQVEVVRAIQGG